MAAAKPFGAFSAAILGAREGMIFLDKSVVSRYTEIIQIIINLNLFMSNKEESLKISLEPDEVTGEIPPETVRDLFRKPPEKLLEKPLEKAPAEAAKEKVKVEESPVGKAAETEKDSQQELKKIEERIDELAVELISLWNQDKGWALTLQSEFKAGVKRGFEREEEPLVDNLNALREKRARQEEALGKKEKKWYKKFFTGDLRREIAALKMGESSVEVKYNKLQEQYKTISGKFKELEEAIKNELTKYYFLFPPSDREKQLKEKFPYAEIYKPTFPVMLPAKTVEEQGKREGERRELEEKKQRAYIGDLGKFFERYGFDIKARTNLERKAA